MKTSATAPKAEVGPSLRLPADIQLLTVFVLDFSDSIFYGGVQDRIQSGVEKYLAALLVRAEDDGDDLRIIKENHDIAIVQLGPY